MSIEGPYFDELAPGQVFPAESSVTLTSGLAAAHQGIVGDRFPLAQDAAMCRSVTGRTQMAAPSLVWDVSIGQSTVATQHVKANLFYRGLAFHCFPVLGDTLSTVTTIAGLRQNRHREGRPATGLAALHIATVDQDSRPVLDYWRCAMLPLRDPDGETGHADDLDTIGQDALTIDNAAVDGWDMDPVRRRDGWLTAGDLPVHTTVAVVGGDVVSSAPELARLTLNVARVHHDADVAGGTRLVYGGHTIGIAASHAARALPGLLAISGWDSCHHTGPVHEGDVLTSVIEVGEPDIDGGAAFVPLRSIITANGDRDVLDWRYVAVFAA